MWLLDIQVYAVTVPSWAVLDTIGGESGQLVHLDVPSAQTPELGHWLEPKA